MVKAKEASQAINLIPSPTSQRVRKSDGVARRASNLKGVSALSPASIAILPWGSLRNMRGDSLARSPRRATRSSATCR